MVQRNTMNIDSLSEMQRRVGQWRQKTFGDVKDESLEKRILDEMEELEEELDKKISLPHLDNGERILKEMGDVLITMLGLCEENNWSLAEVLDYVQSINEKRTWMKYGDGTGRHVK